MSSTALTSLHPVIRQCFNVDNSTDTAEEIQEIVTNDGDSYVFVQSVVTLLTSISDYCKLADQIPQVTSSIDVSMSHESYIMNIAGQH